MLGIAVIGCGGMGSSHARAIANIPGLSVVCGADPSETARSKFSTDFDVPSFERPAEALQRDGVDIAIIAMTHDLHATMLHLMGLNHERLTYRHAGRDMRLTDVHGNVVKAILA